MSLRVIEGGLTEGSSTGLLVVGASAIVTMAGGLRRGETQAETAGRDRACTPSAKLPE